MTLHAALAPVAPATGPAQPGPRPGSRRGLLAGVATGAVVATGVLGSGEQASAATRPRRWRGERLLGPRARHLVGRFSYGVTPGLAREVAQAGGSQAWFEAQLDPASIDDTDADRLSSWWDGFERTPRELWVRNIDGTEGGWLVMQDLARFQLARRMISRRQVHEVMTEFWQNHLNVPVNADAVFTHRVSYDRAIRDNALGSFADLLYASTTHPAMGIYLSNAVSTKTHPNENLGRELLELHSVGRGNYGEEDVKNSARILTGWRVDMWRSWAATYSIEDHWSGPVRVMGFTDANVPRTEDDGRALTRRYTDYLARHPRTAQRIATKLAVKFVGDNPSASLVDRLAQVYLDNDTQVKPVLRALIATPEFLEARGSKVRDPLEDVVATYRALGVSLQKPTADQSAANAVLWQAANLGITPFGWPTPDGQPNDNTSWSSPSRMLASMDMHWAMSGGWWPRVGIGYRAPVDWLPRQTLRYDVLVDYLSQTILHQRATPTLVQACCEAVGVRPGTTITAEHGVVKWSFARVLATVLDSPAHLTR